MNCGWLRWLGLNLLVSLSNDKSEKVVVVDDSPRRPSHFKPKMQGVDPLQHDSSERYNIARPHDSLPKAGWRAQHVTQCCEGAVKENAKNACWHGGLAKHQLPTELLQYWKRK